MTFRHFLDRIADFLLFMSIVCATLLVLYGGWLLLTWDR